MSEYYPILLKLDGKPCVVVGGGGETGQRVLDLAGAGAQVTLISRAAPAEIQLLVQEGRVCWKARAYQPGDLAGAFLVIACPEDRSLNREIWAEAEARGIAVNAIDDLAHCNFIFPAILRRSHLVVAVSSSGKSPALAARIRDRIAREFGAEYGEFAGLLGELRAEMIQRFPDFEQRKIVWYRLVDSGALELLKLGDSQGAEAALRHVMTEAR
ncbi:MAG: bifunctional precorrin-2 dehydrogenase/sirohydrochlorin ferrochelatase [Acidobacteriales bacterium]|nr:MAG: bifunctional precorrin-2 dehydrogenase/sirohydrochlorin ferrochelatase [Terriglobales bacterium]